MTRQWGLKRSVTLPLVANGAHAVHCKGTRILSMDRLTRFLCVCLLIGGRNGLPDRRPILQVLSQTGKLDCDHPHTALIASTTNSCAVITPHNRLVTRGRTCAADRATNYHETRRDDRAN